MKDSFGDKIRVKSEEDDWVWVQFDQDESSHQRSVINMGLTVKKARKLAGKILAAADKAEGK